MTESYVTGVTGGVIRSAFAAPVNAASWFDDLEAKKYIGVVLPAGTMQNPR